ncbi:YfcE family phosphodiesterase [bacterium]|nr:YfcE family phosphodiesterase [bacterium]
MKIAIISDIHDNINNLKKFLKKIKELKIKEIICCGDIGSPLSLNILSSERNIKVHFIFGNIDGDKVAMAEIAFKFRNVILYNEFGELKIKGKKIAFLHNPKIAKLLAKNNEYDVIFYGHTHQPKKEKIGKTLLVNPGEIAEFLSNPTFALYDLEKNKINILTL